MVFTRGHRDNDDSKSNLPQRECRRSRMTLQEPEDEMFWESDEAVTHMKRKTRSVVTFQENSNHHSVFRGRDTDGFLPSDETWLPEASKNLRTRTFVGLLSQPVRGSRVNAWNSQNTSCHSCNDSSSNARIKKVIPNSLKDDMVGVEADTDTDDEFFHHRSTSKPNQCLPSLNDSRRSNMRHHSPIKKEFSMNGDDEMTDKSDHEIRLRRSSRQRKSQSFSSSSWLLGEKKLRGYPNMIHSSEPENDELRPARKPSRYIHSSGETNGSSPPQRRSLRFRKKSPEQRSMSRKRDYLLRKQNSRRLLTRSHRRPIRYRDSQSEGDDEEEEEEGEREVAEEETREGVVSRKRRGRNVMKKNMEARTVSHRRRGRPSKLSHETSASFGGETENSEDEEGEFKQPMLRKRVRINKRGQRRNFEVREASTESEEEKEAEVKEENEGENQEARDEDADEEDNKDSKDNVLPVDKPKRQRKPVSRLMYEPNKPQPSKLSSSDESKDEEEEEDDDEDDEDEEEEEGNEEKDENNLRRYSLRQNRKTLTKDSYSSLDEQGSRRHRKDRDRPSKLAAFINSPARKQKVFGKKYRAAHDMTMGSTSSSSNDEKEFEKRHTKSMNKARNRCLPMNFSPEDIALATVKERSKTGSSLADVDPMHVDTSVTFDSVGGLSHHIKSLKEMIIFPLIYPEVFQKFSITPPRGVLFYGPPGTGKTLVARALAAECSHKNKKVAFFMRKGADCLSKWVGESERQLRLLFDQAYQMRPSIIFFDEIDGLAPVRSSRQDQIHSSIVSTLLALMDGLDSRGEVVVIGATNRVDALDPALRRPGRFDREFNFPLPSIKARKQILDIHTQNWIPKPSKRLVQYLSEQTVGYCGADLKALCAEATLNALRLKYPQIYASDQKLLLDVSKIHIKCCHFKQALAKIVPAGQRVASSPGRKLNKVIQPLLQPFLSLALRNLHQSFPQGFNKLLTNRVVHRPRLLISGVKGQGQTTHLSPAILHALERVPSHKLDLPSLFSVSARAPEEACAQIFHEARRNLPSIIYIPLIDQWWHTVSDTVRATFLSLLNDFDPSTPLLLLATSEIPYNQMDDEVQKLFSTYREETLFMTNPKEDTRRAFFRPLFFVKMTKKPKIIQRKKPILEELPVAPPPQPRKLSENELKKIEEIEEATLRELRIFLRQICAKLAKNRMFYIFTKPVEVDEVPDYLEVIKTPMDLETMMTKIDHLKYQCAEDFLKDIDLICSNALEYNPDRNPEDKLIRHRACTMRDTAYAYIKAEMDTDFEMKCRDIRKARIYREQSSTEMAPDFLKVGPPKTKLAAEAVTEKNAKVNNDGNSTPVNQSNPSDLNFKNKSTGELIRRKKRKSTSWARGFLSTKKRKLCIEKDEVKKEENVKKDGEEKENNEAEAKGRCTNESRCDDDSSLSSSLRCDDDTETFEEQSTDNSQNKNSPGKLGTTQALCNGNLSTEDSRDSMKVTSAADLLYNKSLKESIQKDNLEICVEMKGILRPIPPQIDAEESIVSSSEPGCSLDKNSEVIVDWAHLEAVYESCINITEGVTVDELHYLHTVLTGLVHKYATSLDRAPLLNVVEVELRKFAQFRGKS